MKMELQLELIWFNEPWGEYEENPYKSCVIVLDKLFHYN